MTTVNNILLADNAYGTLAVGLTVTGTSLTFTTGMGARFPVVSSGQRLYCCLLNTTNVLEEIYISAHTAGADSATIVRAQGGTSGLAWSAGDRIEARISGTVLSLISGVMNPENFGAVRDGATDDTGALTSFINALSTSSDVFGQMLNGTYCISTALPQITVSGFRITAPGPSSSHAVGGMNGAVIKWIGGTSTACALTVAPTTGVTAQRLDGVWLEGISVNCNGLLAQGISLQSCFNGYFDVSVQEATSVGLSLGVVAQLGEAADCQFNRIRYTGQQYTAGTGISLQLTGSTAANTSFNWFEQIDIGHSNAFGIDVVNADNNKWGQVRVFQASTGTAVNSIQWRGGTSAAVTARDETFECLSTTIAAIAKGTASYTVGAQRIVIKTLDVGNSTPQPTEELGSTIYDNTWRTVSAVPRSSNGALTSATGTLRFLRELRKFSFTHVGIITTDGQNAGNYQFTIPVTTPSVNYAAYAIQGVAVAGAGSTPSGATMNGIIVQNSSLVYAVRFDGAYPGGDGSTLLFSGFVETA